MKNAIFFTCLLMIMQTGASAQEDLTNEVPQPVRHEGKFGFKNLKGKLVIPAVYDSVHPFTEGVSAVKKNGNWFYLGLNGKPAFVQENGKPLTFKFARPFYHGMAVVSYSHEMRKGKLVVTQYSVINREGQGPDWTDFMPDYLGDFTTGYAIIGEGGRFGVINTCRDQVVPIQFESVDSFSRGYAKVKENGQWRILNPFGQCIENCTGYPMVLHNDEEQMNTIFFSNIDMQFTDISKRKLIRIAETIKENPSKKYILGGNGYNSYAAQQNSWSYTHKVINYLAEELGVNRDQMIFRYGMSDGPYRSVSFKEAAEDEDGPVNTPPPFPGYNCAND